MNETLSLSTLYANSTAMDQEKLLKFVEESYAVNDYVVMVLYLHVFLSAITANIIVILVVFKDQYMRSPTNYFLVNLSIADLLVTLVAMPSATWSAYTTMYYFGEYTCKISEYMQCISVASSIFTITAMAVDRYLAIAKPFGMAYRCFNKTTTVIVIVALWITSLFLFLPILWVYRLHTDYFSMTNATDGITASVCIQDWNGFVISQSVVGIVWFIFMFSVPGIIMLFAYSMMGQTLCSGMPPFDNNDSTCTQQRNKVIKGRKRVACILLLLAFVFAACWLPFHIIVLLLDTGSTALSGVHPETLPKLKRYLLLLGHCNSALNPIIYCALSRKFRNSIKNLFTDRVAFRRRRQLVKWQDSSGSGTQMHYLHRMKAVPAIHNHLQSTLRSRGYQSSQRTTKSFVV